MDGLNADRRHLVREGDRRDAVDRQPLASIGDALTARQGEHRTVKAPDDTAIGGRLRQARAEARITQADAAAALDIARSAVSALETGDRYLTAAELSKCAALYRRPAGWFLGDDSALPTRTS